MRLKTPSFWYRKTVPAIAAGLTLLPLSLIYRIGNTFNQIRIKPHKPEIPVICIGNLTAGGSGKTPVALAIMNLIQSESIARNPCFLSRGYGGTLKGPAFVDPEKHSSHDAGDEPLLLARRAPAIVSADRVAGAALAYKSGHDLIVMDDGLQNRSLVKTLSLVVIDGGTGFGNGFMLPAGPLREPLTSGFEITDAFALIGEDTQNILPRLPAGKPVLRARLAVPDTWQVDKNASYIALSGIGIPEKFKATALEKGLKITGWHAFPDHHIFTAAELDALDKEAAAKSARLLTTEKDAARLPRNFTFKTRLDVMPVHIVWEDENAVCDLLLKRIQK